MGASSSSENKVLAMVSQQRAKLVGALALGAVVFWIDTFTPLASAVAVLYILVLLLAAEHRSERRLWVTAAICVILTSVSFFGTHGGDPELAPSLRYAFSLAAIGVTAFLMRQTIRSRETLLAQARLLDITSDALFTCDSEGRVRFWNDGATRLYGWTGPEMLGRDVHELLDADYPASRSQIQAELAATGAWEGELVQRRRDGAIRIVLSRWAREPGGGFLSTNTDITDLRQASKDLHHSEARYRTIFDTLAISIWEHDLRPLKRDLDGLRAAGVTDIRAYLVQNPEFFRRVRERVPITDVNATALKLVGVGRKDDFFKHLHEFLAEADESFLPFLVALYEGQTSFQAETIVRSRTGELIPVLVALTFPTDGAGFDRILASVFDLSEQRRLQARLDGARVELDQALRAATLGVLSASIAHEVNQPIAAVSNNANAALRWLALDPPNLDEARKALADVTAAADRAGEVVRGVRGLIARAPNERVAIGVDGLLQEAGRFSARDLADLQAQLVLDLQAGEAVLTGDRVLLQQTLMNLMVNAAQAMAQAEAAARVVTARSRIEGEEAVIEILDTGPGFTAEAAERVFQVFFTTKAGGMGLGLAICQSTVAAHEGRILVHPAMAGGGGRVEVRLPLARADVAAA